MVVAKIISLADVGPLAEVVAAVGEMSREADAGTLVGIAVVLLYTGFRYSIDVVGEARKIPTFTRGALHVLDDELARLIREGP